MKRKKSVHKEVPPKFSDQQLLSAVMRDAGLALGFENQEDFLQFVAQRVVNRYLEPSNYSNDLDPKFLRPRAV